MASIKRLNIDEYQINIEKYISAQMFFIKKSLDMKRIENTESISVTVFRSFEKNDKKMKGSSMAHIYNGMTDDEIDTWNIVGHESLREFVRAIEAKLKEKNT